MWSSVPPSLEHPLKLIAPPRLVDQSASPWFLPRLHLGPSSLWFYWAPSFLWLHLSQTSLCLHHRLPDLQLHFISPPLWLHRAPPSLQLRLGPRSHSTSVLWYPGSTSDACRCGSTSVSRAINVTWTHRLFIFGSPLPSALSLSIANLASSMGYGH